MRPTICNWWKSCYHQRQLMQISCCPVLSFQSFSLLNSEVSEQTSKLAFAKIFILFNFLKFTKHLHKYKIWKTLEIVSFDFHYYIFNILHLRNVRPQDKHQAFTWYFLRQFCLNFVIFSTDYKLVLLHNFLIIVWA